MQLSTLQALRSLSLGDCQCEPADYAPLASLPSLDSLALDSSLLPACIGELTRLQALELVAIRQGRNAGIAGALEAAVRPLWRLTHLYLEPASHCVIDPAQIYQILAAVAELPQLRSFGWLGGHPDAQEPVPAGPWLQTLQRLLLPPRIAAASTAVLLAATRLHCLAAGGRAWLLAMHDVGAGPHLKLLRWAPQHPSLRVLGVNLWQTTIRKAGAKFQKQHPGLQIVVSAHVVRAMSEHARLLASFENVPSLLGLP